MFSNSLLILLYAAHLPEHSWACFSPLAHTMQKTILAGGFYLASWLSRDRDRVISAESADTSAAIRIISWKSKITRTPGALGNGGHGSERNHLHSSLQAHLFLPRTSRSPQLADQGLASVC